MPSKFPSPNPFRSAFTLVEILVVIAILGLLAAILFPTFARVRENGRRASCASNLKQIGLAIEQYTQDSDERYPSFHGPAFGIANEITYNTWKTVQPYIKNRQAFYCPSTSAFTDCNAVEGCPESGKEITYGFNVGPVWKQEGEENMGGIYERTSFYEKNGDPFALMEGVHKANIVSTTDMFLASDAYDVWAHSMDPTASFQTPLPTRNSEWRHGNWRNVLFVDGHVKSIPWRAGKNSSSVYFWGEILMVPKNPKYYDSYCANPELPITFPGTPGLTRCGDIPKLLADAVPESDWQTE